MTPAASPAAAKRLWWPLLAALWAVPGFAAWLGPGHYVGNGTDLFSYQYPLRASVAALWRAGQLPWWNPYVLGGVPALAGWQLGLLYPPHLLHLLAPLGATEAMIWLHLAWLGVGFAVLVRAWRPELPVWAVLGLAAAPVLSGPTWGHIWAGHVSFIEALAWLPWLWWAALRLLDARLPRFAIVGAVFLALQLLTGHPQVVYLTLVGLVAVLAARAVAEPQPMAPNAPPWLQKPLASLVALGGLAAIGLGAAVLAAMQLAPTVDLLPELNRSLSNPLEIATSYSAPAASLWTLLAPDLFGGVQGKLGGITYHETVAFLGVGALALGVLGAAQGLPGLLLAGAALVALLLAPGEHGPLLTKLVGVVPGLGSFRVPGRWVTLVVVLAPLLAADGLAALLRPPQPKARPPKTTWIMMGLALLALFAAASSLLGEHGSLAELLAKAPADAVAAAQHRGKAAVILGSLAVFAVLAAALRPAWSRPLVMVLLVGSALQGLSFAQAHLGPISRKPAPAVTWSDADRALLSQTVPSGQRLLTAASLRMANWGGTASLAVAGGYEPAITASANRYGNGLAGRSLDGYAVNFQARAPNAFVQRMAVSHLLVDSEDRLTIQQFSTWPVAATLGTGLQLRKNPQPLPRLAVADAYEVAATPQAALQRIQADANAPVQITGTFDALPPSGAGTLTVITERADHIEASSHCAASCLAVLRDSADPSWGVRIDGKPAQPLIADGVFRAVVLPAGDHRVEWQYRLAGWPWALGLSLLAWLAALAWLWRDRRRAS